MIYRETDSTYYYLHNAHGDVTALTDNFGNIIKDYDYNPYGVEEINPVNNFGKYATISLWQQEIENIDNPFRYCGEYYDQETGSIYLRARYYDPVLGRFTQEDSYKGNIADPLSLNVYSYCSNNPVRYVDPSGHWQEGDDDLSRDAQKIIRDATDDLANGDPTAAARMVAAHEKAEDARRAENAFSFRNVTIISTGTIQQAYISPLTRLLVDKEQYSKDCANYQLYTNLVTGSVGGGSGTTWRAAKNLKQKLAMDEVMSNPARGSTVKLTMQDPRWKAEEGWIKKAKDFGEFEIHWVYNKITGAYDDFKFKVQGGK